jgi:RimJ/RimL family protein N-acetyltransferase
VEGQQAEVHISVASHERGRGYGRRALDLGCRIVVSECAIRRVLAHVKPGNFTSIRLFERAGFVHVGVAVAGGHPAERMAWEPHP